jgi:hypothetical protein
MNSEPEFPMLRVEDFPPGFAIPPGILEFLENQHATVVRRFEGEGKLTRAVKLRGSSAIEDFQLLLDPKPPETYIEDDAVLVDVSTFTRPPRSGAVLAHSRSLGSDRDIAFELFGANLSSAAADSPFVALDGIRPTADDRFWGYVGRGPASALRAREILENVSARPPREITAFAARFYRSLRAIGHLGPNEHPGELMGGGDAHLWWRLAVIARGREAYEQVLSGEPARLTEDEWAAGEDLVGLPERAYEERAGVRPFFHFTDGLEFSLDTEAVSATEALPASEPNEARADEIIVGTRFLAALPDGYVECVALQHIDWTVQDLQLGALRNASTLCTELGGQLVSAVEIFNTRTTSYVSGIGIFEVRRRWKGSLDEYLDHHRLKRPTA